jgi:hypothetical protein
MPGSENAGGGGDNDDDDGGVVVVVVMTMVMLMTMGGALPRAGTRQVNPKQKHCHH